MGHISTTFRRRAAVSVVAVGRLLILSTMVFRLPLVRPSTANIWLPL